MIIDRGIDPIRGIRWITINSSPVKLFLSSDNHNRGKVERQTRLESPSSIEYQVTRYTTYTNIVHEATILPALLRYWHRFYQCAMLRAAVNNRAEHSPFLFHVSRDSQEDMDSTEFPRIIQFSESSNRFARIEIGMLCKFGESQNLLIESN